MKEGQLVFIPTPAAGHLVPTVEIAKLLVDRYDRLSVTILIVKFPSDNKVPTYTESLAAASSRIKFVILPDDQTVKESLTPKIFLKSFMENKKPHVKEFITKLTESPDSTQIAGLVLDMFCTCMIDIADEFKVPSYIFFTSSAGALGASLHLQTLRGEQNKLTTELLDSDAELEIPCFVNSVPARVLPRSLFDHEMGEILSEHARKYRCVKGIMVNTFEELESYAIRSLNDGKTKIPPVYAVGPVLNIRGENYDLGPGGVEKKAEIMTWLDGQPESSVVFLCFGSGGSFPVDQVREIACALEHSGHRFLWSLRRASSKNKFQMPSDYEDLMDVLPDGFLDRTADIGKIVGWAPQVSILGHPAVGGFVSHCGWNSILESIWFNVPLATWPMYAEQQLNAFQLVTQLGLAAEIKLDYAMGFANKNLMVVSAQEIERGIRCLMEPDSEVRTRVKEMSEQGRKALMDGGSSFSSVGRWIDHIP